jgi:beta-aspartyl-peptidase (threonine type)
MILVTNNEGTLGVPTTARRLAEGAHAFDAIEAGIRLIEADTSVRTVGRGGWPNLLGEMELDACMMDGSTLRSGAVGALQGFLHPVSVAREIMRRLPHEFLVGDGAARFAREIGAEAADNLIEDSRRAWQAWFDNEVPEQQKSTWPDTPLAPLCRHAIDPEVGRDTTVFLAHDAAGNICCGTSTSGWGWKYPGRLGDSPIVGAGSYADTRFGAAACTGAGEMTIRCGTARSIVLYMKKGRRCCRRGRRSGGRHACAEGRTDQSRDDPRDRHEGQSQGGRGQWRGRQQVLAVGRAGGAAPACGRAGCDHDRRDAGDHDDAIYTVTA